MKCKEVGKLLDLIAPHAVLEKLVGSSVYLRKLLKENCIGPSVSYTPISFLSGTSSHPLMVPLQVPTVSRGLLENFFHMLMTWSGTPRLAPIKAGPRLEEIPEKVVRDLSSDQKYLRLAIQYSAKEYPDRCQGNV